MTFEEYLFSKKIDSDRFKLLDSLQWEAWKKEFEQFHPNSFTSRNLYKINPIRRKYQLKVNHESSTVAGPVAAPKPVFKPKMK